MQSQEKLLFETIRAEAQVGKLCSLLYKRFVVCISCDSLHAPPFLHFGWEVLQFPFIFLSFLFSPSFFCFSLNKSQREGKKQPDLDT